MYYYILMMWLVLYGLRKTIIFISKTLGVSVIWNRTSSDQYE